MLTSPGDPPTKDERRLKRSGGFPKVAPRIIPHVSYYGGYWNFIAVASPQVAIAGQLMPHTERQTQTLSTTLVLYLQKCWFTRRKKVVKISPESCTMHPLYFMLFSNRSRCLWRLWSEVAAFYSNTEFIPRRRVCPQYSSSQKKSSKPQLAVTE